jgi:hypothetical protein
MYTRYQFLLNIDKKKVSSEHIDRKKNVSSDLFCWCMFIVLRVSLESGKGFHNFIFVQVLLHSDMVYTFGRYQDEW